MHGTLHQAIGRAKLRQDFLPVLDLRAYARLCGEIARASKVLSNKRTLVAFTYATLEQLFFIFHRIDFGGGLALADFHIFEGVGAHVETAVFQHHLYAGGLLYQIV